MFLPSNTEKRAGEILADRTVFSRMPLTVTDSRPSLCIHLHAANHPQFNENAVFQLRGFVVFAYVVDRISYLKDSGV